MIAVYCDQGVSPRSLKHLMSALKGYPVTRVNRHSLIDSLAKISLLIMPGGRDIPYHEALSGKPNQAISHFIHEGGSYLGLCAGGYFGAAEVIFERGYPLEVAGKRELAFFPGKAVGPAYGNGMFQYNSESGSRIAQISWNGKIVGTYFNGGCIFEDAKTQPNTEVLATYDDLPGQPAAIIRCTVGKGTAILAGVHPEYSDTMPSGAKIKNHSSELFISLINSLLNKN